MQDIADEIALMRGVIMDLRGRKASEESKRLSIAYADNIIKEEHEIGHSFSWVVDK